MNSREIKLTFDDVLIEPSFSEVVSRRDVDVSSRDGKFFSLSLPVISSNMDTITGVEMCDAMEKEGGIGCLHRFCTIEENVKMLETAKGSPIVSFGLGLKELKRASALSKAGAKYFCLDVAHGAQMEVVKQVSNFKRQVPNKYLIVGNFASPGSLKKFLDCLSPLEYPNAVKIGIGPGSACTTRIKTGVGYPQLSAIMDCRDMCIWNSVTLIADGGMRTSGDIAKALAAGADFVMLGGMLAGTDETPGKKEGNFKIYRGSASKESYKDQNKDWSTAEGESFITPCKGSVSNVLRDIKGGLKSAFSYVGASNIKEFKRNAFFVQVSNSSIRENGAHFHGKN